MPPINWDERLDILNEVLEGLLKSVKRTADDVFPQARAFRNSNVEKLGMYIVVRQGYMTEAELLDLAYEISALDLEPVILATTDRYQRVELRYNERIVLPKRHTMLGQNRHAGIPGLSNKGAETWDDKHGNKKRRKKD